MQKRGFDERHDVTTGTRKVTGKMKKKLVVTGRNVDGVVHHAEVHATGKKLGKGEGGRRFGWRQAAQNPGVTLRKGRNPETICKKKVVNQFDAVCERSRGGEASFA